MIQLGVRSVFDASNVSERRVLPSKVTAILRAENDRLELLDLHGPSLLDVWRDLLVFSNHIAQDSKGVLENLRLSISCMALERTCLLYTSPSPRD